MDKDIKNKGEGELTEDKAEKEYHEAYHELGEKEKKDGDKPDGTTVAPTDTDDEAAKQKKEEDARKAAEDAYRKKKEDAAALEAGGTPPKEKSEDHGSVESLEKALTDTKTYATKLAQELADLKKVVEAQKAGTATQAQVDEQRKVAEKAKNDLTDLKTKVYADYPELQPLLDPILEKNEKLTKTVEELQTAVNEKSEADKERDRKNAEREARVEAKETFEREVKPDILKVHPDFDNILADEGYWEWAKKQTPAKRFAAMNSPDPTDIIEAVTAYKTHLADPEVQKIKEKEAAEKKKKLENASSLRGGSREFPGTGKKPKDPEDYKGGWDEAGEQLKKEGIGA